MTLRRLTQKRVVRTALNHREKILKVQQYIDRRRCLFILRIMYFVSAKSVSEGHSPHGSVLQREASLTHVRAHECTTLLPLPVDLRYFGKVVLSSHPFHRNFLRKRGGGIAASGGRRGPDRIYKKKKTLDIPGKCFTMDSAARRKGKGFQRKSRVLWNPPENAGKLGTYLATMHVRQGANQGPGRSAVDKSVLHTCGVIVWQRILCLDEFAMEKIVIQILPVADHQRTALESHREPAIHTFARDWRAST